MDLLQLRNDIISEKKHNFYMFTGPEVQIMDIYIKRLEYLHGINKVREMDIKSVFSKTRSKSSLKQNKLYVVRDDLDFLKHEESWDNIDNMIGENVLILVYTNFDKRSKFYKHFKDIIVEFEKLSSDQLAKYIMQEFNNKFSSALWLAEICEHDYSRILLECDKIKLYSKITGKDYEGSFKELIELGNIYVPVNNVIFDFTNSILKRDIYNTFKLWKSLKEKESAIKVLSILYNSMRNVLIVQSSNNPTTQNTGLSGWNIKCAKELCGYYSTEELLKNINIIRQVEKGIKTGVCDQEIAIDYMLVNVL